MPKITFSTENKVQQDNRFPKLSLEYGDRALIVAIEPEPEVEYVHTLQAPAIGPDGKVIKEERKNSKGETYVAPKMEFFGQHLCFGAFDVLTAKGSDPANCPTCAAAAEGEGIVAPKPKYAMNVLQYTLQPNSWTVRDPFNVDVVAWTFAADRFNTLIDLAAEWKDLRKHDLKLGPCQSAVFQKYDIQVANSAQWMADDARKKQAIESYDNNKCTDLSSVIGRKVDKSKALEDIQRVRERLQQAYHTPSSSAATQAFDNATSSEPETISKPAEAASTEATGESATWESVLSDL